MGIRKSTIEYSEAMADALESILNHPPFNSYDCYLKLQHNWDKLNCELDYLEALNYTVKNLNICISKLKTFILDNHTATEIIDYMQNICDKTSASQPLDYKLFFYNDCKLQVFDRILTKLLSTERGINNGKYGK
jgi:hypothetical protein